MPVPTRSEVLDDLYTTTWTNRKKEVVDSIFTATPLTRELMKRGGITLNGTGGRFIELPLAYAKNETVKSLGRGDTISLSETKFMTVAQFNWKYLGGSIIRYFVDDTQNKSIQEHINWANAKINNLRDSLTDLLETQLFGDGTGNASKDLDGLANIVSTTPTTGTVGNINSATFTWWQNRQKTSTGPASVYLLSDMRNLANTTSESKTRMWPNIVITTQAVAELYGDEVLEQRNIIQTSGNDAEPVMGDAWHGIKIQWSSQCPSGRMYMLNSEYCGLNIDPDVNFQMTDWKPIPNQINDRVCQIVMKGNFISNRRASLGVLTAIA